MNAPRLIAAIIGLICPLAMQAGNAAIPVIRLGEPEPLVHREPPPLTFSVPKYTLTEVERETIATCLVLEAASQGEFGMRGVMAVIRNRARGRPELLVTTVLRAKQFSALNKLTSGRETLAHVIDRAKRDNMWPCALTIVSDAITDEWHDPTDGATHYTRSVEQTPWTRHLAKTVTIGKHSFYR